MVSSNHKANKQQMHRRYKDYAIKHNKGKLTLEEFHNVITKQRHIECIKVQGKNIQIASMNPLIRMMMTSTDMRTPLHHNNR